MPDEIVHQTVSLKVMSALNALPPTEMLAFVWLKTIAGATDGNLGARLATLENAGYVKTVKDFAAAARGRHAFRDYVAYLREILESGGRSDKEKPRWES